MIYSGRRESLMEKKAKKTTGPLSLPKDIESCILKTIDYEYPYRKISVELTSDEFTCVCPFSGLPDFALLTIHYIPGKKLIELKSLKYYLYAFRNVKVYNEHAVNKILEDLVKVLSPVELCVTAEFTSRGGVKNRVSVKYSKRK